MKTILIAAATSLALAAAPAAAFAGDKDHGKGKYASHSKAHKQAYKQAKHADKQARKMWRQGERLPATYITQRYYVAEPARYSLAPAPYGYQYVRVDDQIYLAQTQTGLISQVISSLLR
ncbi:RcnB family protein [Phenylobacterium sp.]|uniref:RcnB family protein n=1 Tax=Phenylobacterium sp. TaxID=1871053 RepID=UPI003982DC26